MDMETLREASERGAAFFESQLDDNGRLKDPEAASDLACIYKVPMLLVISGRGRLAHKVLDRIKECFMQEDGDFLSYPEKSGDARKSSSAALNQHWPYMNGWIAMAAHKLGRFDISYPAWGFLKQFYNPVVGGFGTSGRYEVSPSKSTETAMTSGTREKYNVGIFISSHLGLTALFMGDVDKAKASGDLMVRMVDQQPDLGQHFLLHVNGQTGQLVTEPSDDLKLFYRMLRSEPNELFYQLGYPCYFLHHLYKLTKEDEYLEAAECVLDFALTLHENLYAHFLCHKVAWGAALVSSATDNAKYREMSLRCIKFLLSLQTSNGDFLPELGKQTSLDQTAEICVWLRELSSILV